MSNHEYTVFLASPKPPYVPSRAVRNGGLLLLSMSLLFSNVSCGGASTAGLNGGRSHADLNSLVDNVLREAHLKSAFSTRLNTPSEIVHGSLGLGPKATIYDDEERREIELIEYIRRGGPFQGCSIYSASSDGFTINRGRYHTELEGHPNQFLAYYAQMQLPEDMLLRCGDRSFVVKDLVDTATRLFTPEKEGTFTLIAFAHYLKVPHWETVSGKVFTIGDLIASELRVDKEQQACGGTHTNFALAYVWKNRRQWLDDPALSKMMSLRLDEDLQRVRRSQKPDGVLPFPAEIVHDGEWKTLESYEAADFDVYSTGHNLEWLMLWLSDEELEMEWVRKAVWFLGESLIRRSDDPPSAACYYHAIHAIQLYRNRVVGVK